MDYFTGVVQGFCIWCDTPKHTHIDRQIYRERARERERGREGERGGEGGREGGTPCSESLELLE